MFLSMPYVIFMAELSAYRLKSYRPHHPSSYIANTVSCCILWLGPTDFSIDEKKTMLGIIGPAWTKGMCDRALG